MLHYGAGKIKSDLGRRSTLSGFWGERRKWEHISEIKGLNERNNGNTVKSIREIESRAKKDQKVLLIPLVVEKEKG